MCDHDSHSQVLRSLKSQFSRWGSSHICTPTLTSLLDSAIQQRCLVPLAQALPFPCSAAPLRHRNRPLFADLSRLRNSGKGLQNDGSGASAWGITCKLKASCSGADVAGMTRRAWGSALKGTLRWSRWLRILFGKNDEARLRANVSVELFLFGHMPMCFVSVIRDPLRKPATYDLPTRVRPRHACRTTFNKVRGFLQKMLMKEIGQWE